MVYKSENLNAELIFLTRVAATLTFRLSDHFPGYYLPVQIVFCKLSLSMITNDLHPA